MLVPLSNVPRDYAWGSREAIARLQGRPAASSPEAELWFGDHPGAPALVGDGSGRSLDAWIAQEGPAHGLSSPLPFLLKLLAAESPLSIQAHPTIAQAREGFAREERAGIPRDAPHRNYRDDNHKPEVIVAIEGDFEALAGFRPVEEIVGLLDALGVGDPAIAQLRQGLRSDPDSAIAVFLGSVLAGEVAASTELIAAASTTQAPAFDDDLAALRRIESAHPGDPGVVVALLMNRVVLHEGEALFVPAGIPHAYLRGLGVEIMAASDNVLRGGLTPKHVDVSELLEVLSFRPGRIPLLDPRTSESGIDVFAPPVGDFALLRVRRIAAADETSVPLDGPAIAVTTRGRVAVSGRAHRIELAPGQACLISPDEHELRIGGEGEVFLATPGGSVPA